MVSQTGRPAPFFPRWAAWALQAVRTWLSSLAAPVNDDPGWWALGSGSSTLQTPQEQSAAYRDSLAAWRTHPMAWRMIALMRDHILGDGIALSSPNPDLEAFTQRFWHHRKNRLDLRLEAMVDELNRCGDLFILLFRSPADGMSYLRFLTREEIAGIETAPNDREQEWVYHQHDPTHPGATLAWLSPDHPQAAQAEVVCLHYAVNRPVGALYGAGELDTLLPWLNRYQVMLEGRARLHIALRTFLWFITVPANRVAAKIAQYRRPPEPGSVVVKDPGETWEVQAPALHAADARHDLDMLYRMLLAGSGLPGHWLGDQDTANLATARAAQSPAERTLRRRQLYMIFMLQDLALTAYRRAAGLGKVPSLDESDPGRLFQVRVTEISRDDNLALAQAAESMARAMDTALSWQPENAALRQKALDAVFQAGGIGKI